MKEMLKLYRMLNDTQKNKLFTKEQRKCLDEADFFDRLFGDSVFYKSVETAVAEAAYEQLRA